MNHHAGALAPSPTREEAAEAAALLRRFAEADPEGAAALAPFGPSRTYPEGFTPDAAYRATLPDTQNAPPEAIRGARRVIQHVGVSNLRIPLRHALFGRQVTLETAVTATVSLGAEAKGINMSRLARLLDARAGALTGWALMDAVLDDYRAEVGGPDARLVLRAAFPLRQRALRSGLEGWRYYDAAMEMAEVAGVRRRILHLDYVYSSTCPCSLALSEHAGEARGQLATPHSQRSVARVSAVLADEALGVAELVALLRRAVPTEVQAIVKREDEQAFAELNAAHPIFVEDAVRLIAEALEDDPRAGDFRIAASHQESLHAHDAVAVLSQGEAFAAPSLDPWTLGTLVPRG